MLVLKAMTKMFKLRLSSLPLVNAELALLRDPLPVADVKEEACRILLTLVISSRTHSTA
jgi:hypothetical protein